jgi:hypothetical protein
VCNPVASNPSATTAVTTSGGDITKVDCAAPPANSVLGSEDVYAEALRLVPPVGIESAPPSGLTLVNLETLFWADTATDRSLGTVALLGHQVSISVHVDSVLWQFGDGESATSSGPGRRYGPEDHCRTAQCPGWFGHTYVKTGAFTVTATVNWSGSYRVDGGSVQPIAGTVRGPGASVALVVKQARAVLVPDPTSS